MKDSILIKTMTKTYKAEVKSDVTERFSRIQELNTKLAAIRQALADAQSRRDSLLVDLGGLKNQFRAAVVSGDDTTDLSTKISHSNSVIKELETHISEQNEQSKIIDGEIAEFGRQIANILTAFFNLIGQRFVADACQQIYEAVDALNDWPEACGDVCEMAGVKVGAPVIAMGFKKIQDLVQEIKRLDRYYFHGSLMEAGFKSAIGE